MRKLAFPALLVAAALLAATTAPTQPDYSSFTKKLAKNDQILHALNRLGFGPRPGDVSAAEKLGLKKWLDLQLHPERLPENKILAEKLAPLDSLQMTSAEAVAAYPPARLIRA